MHTCVFFSFHVDAISQGICLSFGIHLIQCLTPITLKLCGTATSQSLLIIKEVSFYLNCGAASVGEYNKIILVLPTEMIMCIGHCKEFQS